MRAGSKVEHLQDEQGLILSQLVKHTQTKKRHSFKSLLNASAGLLVVVTSLHR